jgi:hypothetical protein
MVLDVLYQRTEYEECDKVLRRIGLREWMVTFRFENGDLMPQY